jgi:hypothetical protein
MAGLARRGVAEGETGSIPSFVMAGLDPAIQCQIDYQRRSRFHHRLDGRVERPAMTSKGQGR